MDTDIPYGSRGYLIDRRGEITPINDMYGHEAFVKKRSKEFLSPINFVADNGWVLVQTVADHSVITLCDETVTKQAISSTIKVLGAHHRKDKITVTNYNRETDIENQLVSYANLSQVTRLFIKLKSGAETASFLKIAEIASRDIKLSILEEKAKILILQKNFRVFHEIKIDPSEGKETIYIDNEGKQTKYFIRSWAYLWALIANADPTKNKQYLQWLITKALKNDHEWRIKRFSYWKEDLESIRFTLEKFDEFKRKGKIPPEFRDIQKFKDDLELYKFVNNLKIQLEEDALGSIEDRENKFFDNKEAKVFYESASMRVVIPFTPEASCFFGRQTNWCTAIPKRPEIFGEYSAEGKLYIIEDKTIGLKYQFHFESMQFMNNQDHPIDFGGWHEERYPILKELIAVFDKIATKHDFAPLMRKPTVKTYIAMLSSESVVYQTSGVIYLFRTHIYAKPSEKDKKNFLDRLVWKFINTYGLSWFSTGSAEESLSKLFNIARANFENEFPFVILESNIPKDASRILINKISRNVDSKVQASIEQAFKEKFGESLRISY